MQIFVQIVDEQDGGAVLSGRILIFAVEFCQQSHSQQQARWKKGTMIMSQMHSLCIFKDDY
jgi:hypothetical protein